MVPVRLNRRERFDRRAPLVGHVSSQCLQPIADIGQWRSPPQFQGGMQQRRGQVPLAAVARRSRLGGEPPEAVPIH